MLIYRDIDSLQKYLGILRKEGKSIGFVPTMGALHDGHMALLGQSINTCDRSLVSIFVNPKQFNNQSDLSKYPRPVEDDIQKLYDAHCDVVFIPSVDEMYPQADNLNIYVDLDGLDERMEGKYRPGHFQGVAQVMNRLLIIVQPASLFMGQKDFQQTIVVQHLIQQFNLNVDLVICPTIRAADGLALSSRNQLLDPELRAKSSIIFQTLQLAKLNANSKSVEEIRNEALENLTLAGFKPEYFEIADSKTLLPVEKLRHQDDIVICCAVWVGNVRLIDNILIKARQT